MPKLIEYGYLYIAQPPLYKIKKGSSEVYVKNEQALQNYIVQNATNNSILKSKAGDRAGADLQDFIVKLTKFSHLISSLSRVISADIAENLALAGAFDKSWVADAKKTSALIKKIEKRFAENCDEQTTWECKITQENDIELMRQTRGVNSTFVVKNSHLDLPEIAVISQIIDQINDDFSGSLKFIRGDEEKSSNRPIELLNFILEAGKKGVSIQRFKGLGEMNAEQLWETTLDPANRTLLQVKIDQFDEADQTFSVLMGNVVEPRRDFIQENALKVVNLDV